ncbi:hypothetical protein [Arenimonas sp.]|uniref:hypothetical protein n=1 Tax=Arenimonas sp. TaxID=1872635 RepID=UPI0039E6BC9B
MNHRIAFAAFTLSTVLATVFAPPARAEQTMYGLNREQVAFTMACGGESSLRLAEYSLYSSGQPLEKAVERAMTSLPPGKAPPPKALVEERLRVIYEAKPSSMPAWGSSTFVRCLAARQVPLDAERSGVCYLLSYYLSVVVPGYRKRGMAEDAIVERLIEPSASKDMRDRLRALVEYYSKRDAKDVKANVMRDTSHFLKCVAPDKPALSE